MGNMIFEPMNFVNNLVYMGVGMLGVFIIVAIIMFATYGIKKATAKKNGSEEDQA
jgi:hypothetical protein